MNGTGQPIDLGRGLVLANPVGLASGTAGYGFELERLIDLQRVGALYTKGTTPEPRAGNAPPRLAEVAGGLLNSIGLQNPGIDAVVRDYAPRFARWSIPVVLNIAGATVDDYVYCVRRLEGVEGVAGIELNISCPNIAHGLDFGREPAAAARLTEHVRAVTERHVMVKLSPNVTDIAAVARAVEAAGADSVSAVNTYAGMKIDRDGRRPVLTLGGGLSGPAIHAQAVAAVAAVTAAVRIPVVAAGGIDSADTADDFLAVGAAALQVGTANFIDPGVSVRIADALRQRAPAAMVVRRRAVRLLLVDEQDRLLLLHYLTPDTGEDFWCTPGGALEPGETREAAARREVLEETGLQVRALPPQVFEREHRFRVGDGRVFHQHESFHAMRVAHFAPDTTRMGDFEQQAVVGHRWWTLPDLQATQVVLQPPDLARRLAAVLPMLAGRLTVNAGA